MSYTTALFHIVFCTKKRQKSLSVLHKDELRRYIYGIAENLRCDIVILNMMEEHVHILVDLSPEVALAKFVGTVKQSSSLWLKRNINYAMFDGWAKEYYGVSVSPTNKENVNGYIANQELHHSAMDFEEELKRMVETLGLQFYENGFN